MTNVLLTVMVTVKRELEPSAQMLQSALIPLAHGQLSYCCGAIQCLQYFVYCFVAVLNLNLYRNVQTFDLLQ